jgi:hypothetical protein
MTVKSGILGKTKPNGSALLYRAPLDSATSAVINIANDGTGAAYSIGLKSYDQRLNLDADTYNFATGYVVSNYKLSTTTPIPAGATPGSTLLSADGASTAKFNKYLVPAFTTIFVKDVLIKRMTLESTSGTIAVGDTLTKGTGAAADVTTALVFEVFISGSSTIVVVGPETVGQNSSNFADGDILAATSGGNGTVSAGGIGNPGQDFVFSTTTAGGTYNSHFSDPLTVLTDRKYRFDVSDSSMSGKLFKFSQTINGEWGPDGDFTATGDNGVSFIGGVTTSGTAGSSSAYVQMDFAVASLPAGTLYFYEGTTATAGNAGYGGDDRLLTLSSTYTYQEISVFDVVGTWSATTIFTFAGLSYVVDVQTVGKYGYVKEWDSANENLDIILGLNSAAFAGSDVFDDAPISASQATSATVSSVTVDALAIGADQQFVTSKTLSANAADRLTSIVVGPGESIVVNNATQNNSFILHGFQENSTEFTVGYSA